MSNQAVEAKAAEIPPEVIERAARGVLTAQGYTSVWTSAAQRDAEALAEAALRAVDVPRLLAENEHLREHLAALVLENGLTAKQLRERIQLLMQRPDGPPSARVRALVDANHALTVHAGELRTERDEARKALAFVMTDVDGFAGVDADAGRGGSVYTKNGNEIYGDGELIYDGVGNHVDADRLVDLLTENAALRERIVTIESGTYQQACLDVIKLLEDGGYGAPGKSNTIRAMAREAVDLRKRVEAEFARLRAEMVSNEAYRTMESGANAAIIALDAARERLRGGGE